MPFLQITKEKMLDGKWKLRIFHPSGTIERVLDSKPKRPEIERLLKEVETQKKGK